MDGHGHKHRHKHKFNKEADNPPSSWSNMPTIIIVSLYVPTQSYITINNSRRRRVTKSVIIVRTVFMIQPYNI